MTTDDFWAIIQNCRCTQSSRIQKINVDCLTKQLTKLPEPELFEFDRILCEYLLESYDVNLWAAAYIYQDGISDTAFELFRLWLIAQGEKSYKQALANPDTLDELVPPNMKAEDFKAYEAEEFQYIAQIVYQEKTGEDDYYDKRPYDFPGYRLKGKKWKDTDELIERFPELCKKVNFGVGEQASDELDIILPDAENLDLSAFLYL